MVSTLRNIELISSCEQGGFCEQTAIRSGRKKHETTISNCLRYSSSSSTIRNTKLKTPTRFKNMKNESFGLDEIEKIHKNLSETGAEVGGVENAVLGSLRMFSRLSKNGLYSYALRGFGERKRCM